MAPRPIRLRRLRKAGFDLQATSLAANGLSAVCVDRSTIWGNPFSVEVGGRKVRAMDGRWHPVVAVPSLAEALARYEASLLADKKRRARLPELAGKNLACWCAISHNPYTPCHADVLLERVANFFGSRVTTAAGSRHLPLPQTPPLPDMLFQPPPQAQKARPSQP